MSKMNGFTMIELLVVMAVIGIILALASPRVHRMMPGFELRTGATDLAAALRATRAEALRSGARADLAIDLRSGRYLWPSGKGEAALPKDILVDVVADSMLIDRVRQTARMSFFPDGTAAGGSISLVRPETGSGARVAIDWLTGRVAVTDIE